MIRTHSGNTPVIHESRLEQIGADCIELHVQDPSQPVFKADSDWAPLLLTFVANRSNREVAMVSGAQKVYKDLKRPKGYACSFPAPAWPVPLMHLHTCTAAWNVHSCKVTRSAFRDLQ